MALQQCPECGGQVSSSAPACPHCGFSPSRAHQQMAMQQPQHRVQTVEATSKQWKAGQAIGGIACAIGTMSFCGGIGSESPDAALVGLLIGGLGFLLYLGSRIAAWWHNG